MLAVSYGTVSDIEVLWTLLALIGALYSTYNVKSALGDLRALGSIGNGRRLVAVTAFKSEVARLAVQIIFFAIGIMAFFVPDSSNAGLPLRYVIYGALIRWGLILGSGLILYKSYLGATIRRTLRSGTYTYHKYQNLVNEDDSHQVHVEGSLQVTPGSPQEKTREGS